MIRRTSLLFGLLLLFVGCGERRASDADTDTDADTGSVTQKDGATSANAVPVVHRPSGSVCPSQRGAGTVCTIPPDTFAAGSNCSSDADCTAGANGRCIDYNGPIPTCYPNTCSYDTCFSDSDCPKDQPCLCRGSADSNVANTCKAGGNCAIDSDCGPGGECSPGSTQYWCGVPGYFCHTAQDTCVNDSDCPANASGHAQECDYDVQAGYFACAVICPAPP
jgi:hypothetical protein